MHVPKNEQFLESVDPQASFAVILEEFSWLVSASLSNNRAMSPKGLLSIMNKVRP